MVCSENVEVGVDNAPIYRISLFIDWKSSAEIDASNFDL